MPEQFIGGLPRWGALRTATYRKVFFDGMWNWDLAGGKIINGTLSREAQHTGNLDTIRAGVLMGRVTSTGLYAVSILGVTTNAEAIGSTTIEVSAAVAVELVRRIGATGTFTLTGPPAANGAAISETITYSAVNQTTGDITVTATVNPFVAGSFVGGTDGSQVPQTMIPDGYGIKVTDADNSTSLNQPFANLPIGGLIESGQLMLWPSDTGLRSWIVGRLNGQGTGMFTFTHLY